MLDKYNSTDLYVMSELKEAHEQIRIFKDDMFKAAQEIRSLRVQVANQNQYIIELEEKLGIKGEV